jgi:hypothetical protein
LRGDERGELVVVEDHTNSTTVIPPNRYMSRLLVSYPAPLVSIALAMAIAAMVVALAATIGTIPITTFAITIRLTEQWIHHWTHLTGHSHGTRTFIHCRVTECPSTSVTTTIASVTTAIIITTVFILVRSRAICSFYHCLLHLTTVFILVLILGLDFDLDLIITTSQTASEATTQQTFQLRQRAGSQP